MVAKILHAFGGYTVDTLLAEPVTRFFALIKLADRVVADRALSATTNGSATRPGDCNEKLEQHGDGASVADIKIEALTSNEVSKIDQDFVAQKCSTNKKKRTKDKKVQQKFFD